MKKVVLSADGERYVYSVPDEVADNLNRYCNEFCDWIYKSPEAVKYKCGSGVCYNEADFIEYLNIRIFPKQKSELIENLSFINFGDDLPGKYRNCPEFNF